MGTRSDPKGVVVGVCQEMLDILEGEDILQPILENPNCRVSQPTEGGEAKLLKALALLRNAEDGD